MNSKLKTALLIAAAIAIIWLLYLVLSPSKQYDSHTPQATDVKTDYEATQKKLVIVQKENDSLKAVIEQTDSARKIVQADRDQKKTLLNQSTGEIKRLTTEIREYNKDTGFFGHMVDSLVEQVNSLQFLLDQYTERVATTDSAYDKQSGDYQALVASIEGMKSELQEKYDKLYVEYNRLLADYKSQGKSLKRERLKTKVAALLALVAGAAAVLK